jgi:hypothetical protein
MSITSRAPFEIEKRLAGAGIGHSAEHRRGIAREKIHEHLEASRRLVRFGFQAIALSIGLTIFLANVRASSNARGLRAGGSSFCRSAARRIGGRFLRILVPAAILFRSVLAKFAVFGEEAPVDDFESFFLFRISHGKYPRMLLSVCFKV